MSSLGMGRHFRLRPLLTAMVISVAIIFAFNPTRDMYYRSVEATMSKIAEQRQAALDRTYDDLCATVDSIPIWFRWNYLLAHAPLEDFDRYITRYSDALRQTQGVAPLPALLDAPWMGDFALPKLKKPACDREYGGHRLFTGNFINETESKVNLWPSADAEAPPVFLMYHIFSAAIPSERKTRAFIRRYSPLNFVPKNMRHLIEVKFVVGRSTDPSEEEAMDKEEMEFQDLVRLDGLYHGENMNQGKSLAWLRWLGRPGGREAMWVLKCDQDTLGIVPNLLAWLAASDPKKPTYFGTTLQRDNKFWQYYGGPMYGFSWGVVKTFAAAKFEEHDLVKDFPEDVRMGELIWSLPSQPGMPREPSGDIVWDTHPEVSPDERTGLVRLDGVERIADYDMSFRSLPEDALAWHKLKQQESYEEQYSYIFSRFKELDIDPVWDPPAELYKYRSRCA